jgi:UDP-N-acetylmuramyl pentapeptide phosphotransferase/UDP-N-acetylglucosamine-1-phosphate transferase
VPDQMPVIRLASLALAGACVGFLPFNLPNARLFLGDVGSHAIAGAVIGLTLLSVHSGSLSLPEACMLSSVLWVDALITLVRRTFAGRTLWRAHREHLYQFAVRRGFAPWRVCLAYAVLTALAMIGMFAIKARPLGDQWGVAAAWFVALTGMHAVARRRLLERSQRGAA